MNHLSAAPALKRALGLPLLVFYGLGVTVGAGIFALVGKIVGIAGDHAPIAFLVAGIVAAATARAYAILARRYPRAGGAAVYAHESFGALSAASPASPSPASSPAASSRSPFRVTSAR